MSSMNLDMAPGWRPEPGDKVVGTVMAVDRMRSNQGAQEYYPVLTIRPEEPVRIADPQDKEQTIVSGEEALAVHCFHAVLKSRVLSNRPRVGERIGIQYQGTQPTQDGKRTVAVYVVRVEGSADRDPYAGLEDTLNAPSAAPDLPILPGDFQPPNQPAQGADDDIPF